MLEQEELLREIAEITKQYKAEVPSRGGAWPKAIRSRVATLLEQGVHPKAIATATGVPYSTIFMWNPRRGGKFREIKALPAPESRDLAVRSVDSALRVVTSKGLRIEGLSFEQFLACLERLK